MQHALEQVQHSGFRRHLEAGQAAVDVQECRRRVDTLCRELQVSQVQWDSVDWMYNPTPEQNTSGGLEEPGGGPEEPEGAASGTLAITKSCRSSRLTCRLTGRTSR